MKLEKLIREAEEIVFSEFGILPEKSTYDIHGDWHDFAERTGSHPDSHGVYFPRDLSAHVKEGSEYLPVNLMHEYLGHGLYCEHSVPGRKIVALEKELEDIEKEILAVEGLPKKIHFQISSENPYFDDYKAKKDELENHFIQNIQVYEGFAMWLENHLAEKTGYENMFAKKMDRLVHDDYGRLLQHFSDYSDADGNLRLLEAVGFII